MHGIVRTRNLKEGTDPKYTNIRRIEVRYSGQLVEVLTKASSIAEWAQVSERYAD